MDSRRNPWTTLSSRQVYENPWIAVREDRVLRPDGQPGIYGVVHFQSLAVGVVQLTDDGQTILVGQYRYPLDLYSWEIPEGGGELGVDPLESAKRELREETGLVAKHWTYLGEAHLSNSATDETACVFLAEGLTEGAAEPEGTEELLLRRVPFARAVEMALSGEISDALAVIGLLRAHHFLQSGRAWQPIERSFPGHGRPHSGKADPAYAEALRHLVEANGLDRHALFFVTGEGRQLRNGLEEMSGYVVDASGRVFSFWTGWDLERDEMTFRRWNEVKPEPAWLEEEEYREALGEVGRAV